MKNRFLNSQVFLLALSCILLSSWTGEAQIEILNIDGFDYPIGNRGFDNHGNPISILNTGEGWHCALDFGVFYIASETGLHPAEDWNKGSGSYDKGQPVYAIANGEVEFVRPTIPDKYKAGGYTICLKHLSKYNEIFYSYYTHVTCINNSEGNLCTSPIEFTDENQNQIKKGIKVRKGAMIARIAKGNKDIDLKDDPNAYDGYTHLHFEITTRKDEDCVLDRKNGYYTNGPEINWNKYKKKSDISPDDLQTALKNMQSEGKLDPSDFIDQHRYPWYKLNDGTEIYAGSAKNPLSKIPIWFELPASEQTAETKMWIDEVEYPKLLISGGLSRPNNRHEFNLNLSSLKNIGFKNQIYDIKLFINGKYWVNGKKQLLFCDPDEFADNKDANNWYYYYVRDVINKGIVKGSKQESSDVGPLYNCMQTLTRGEAAKFIVLAALNLNHSGDNIDLGRLIDLNGKYFMDVDEKNEYFPYIQTLKNWKNAEESCISTENVKFNFINPITIEQFSKIICNVFYLSENDVNIQELKKGQILGSKNVITVCSDGYKRYVELLRKILVFKESPNDIGVNFTIGERLVESFFEPKASDLIESPITIDARDPMNRSMMAKLISNVYAFRKANPYVPPGTTKSASILTNSMGSVNYDNLGNYTIIGNKFELTSTPTGNAPDQTLEGSVTMAGGESRTFDFQTDTWEGQPLFFYWTLDGGDMVPASANNRSVTVTAPDVTEETDIHLYSYRGTPAGKVGIVYITIHVKPAGPEPVKKVLAWFRAEGVTDGNAPLNVKFINLTLIPQGVTQISYLWNFGDGSESTLPQPEHTYLKEGNYTVSLKAMTPDYSNTMVKNNYISVLSYDQSTAIHKIEYYFDADPGVGNGLILSQGSYPLMNASSEIDISGLSTGMHTIFFRAQDSKGNWGVPQSKPFMVMEESPEDALPEIYSAEYYLDNTSNRLSSHRTSQQTDIFSGKRLDLDNVGEGLHQLLVRVKDFKGKYSPFVARPFYVNNAEFTTAPIGSFEYTIDSQSDWISRDAGEPALQVTGYPFIGLENLSGGMHSLFIRPVTTENQVGTVLSKPFYLQEEKVEDAIAGFQYSIDNLNNFGTLGSTFNDLEVTASRTVDISVLSEGLHTLHVMALGLSGKFGNVLSKPFYALQDEAGITDIVGLEYSIDAIADNGNGTPIAITPGKDVTAKPVVDLSQVNPGLHSIHFKAKDANNNWGVAKNALFNVVDVTNGVPVAHAGVDQLVSEDELVILDGTLSLDPDGNTLTYHWTAPPGVVMNLQNPVQPSFVVPTSYNGTTLTFTLVVHDGLSYSAPDEVIIQVDNVAANHIPVADAGYYDQAVEGAHVQLSGWLSYDEDEDPLTYQWTAPSGIVLSSETSPEPTFTAPTVLADSVITFTLVVHDGISSSVPDMVQITVVNPNHLPVADPGSDLVVTEGDLVTLHGTASSDIDGDRLSFYWATPEGITLSSDTIANPVFTAPDVDEDTEYTLLLRVFDGEEYSQDEELKINVTNQNSPPVANAGANRSVKEGELVVLNGTASSDPNSDALTYLWTSPSGISLSNATSPTPTFTAPVVSQETSFTFTLVVNDGTVDSPPDQVVITVHQLMTYVPDDNFEQALIELGFDTGSLNDSVPSKNIQNILSLEIRNKNITNLIGIEAFISLKELYCEDNQLTSLDLSQNLSLSFLYISRNRLSSLDVSKNILLTQFEIMGNQLTNIDVSQNSLLEYLSCGVNQLTNIDISQNNKLIDLECYNNQITNLDVSLNPELKYLNCSANQLASLSLSNNKFLTRLYCALNQLTSLDLSKNSALCLCICVDNKLTLLNIRNGNNFNMTGPYEDTGMNAGNNPFLNCIEVDDPLTSSEYADWIKDTQAGYSADCNIINSPPLANAGPDQTVNERTLVNLDGSASSDPDGDELTYLWTAPAGITLSNATSSTPSFTAPEVSLDTEYTFTLIVNDGNAGSAPDDVKITVKGQSLLHLKVFLEGPYDSGTGLMGTALNTGNQIPLDQPFNAAPWNYAGTESVTSIPADVTDWVLVELRDAATPAEAITSFMKMACFLKSDGTIVGMDGTSLPGMGSYMVTNNLYVVVRHRNHIAVMSSEGLVLSGNTYVYDFSTAITKAYNGAAGYKQIATGVFGMVTGDADADGSVYPSDYNQWASKYNSTGYKNSDFDMDTNVYPSDYNKWATNYNKGNPLLKTSGRNYRSQVPGDK